MSTDEQQFVSEPITPDAGTFSTGLMASGLASLPESFVWRNRRYRIIECLEHGKQSGVEPGGSEVYLRRQVFVVRLDSGQEATLYVLRQAPRGARPAAARRRWFLYSIGPEPTQGR